MMLPRLISLLLLPLLRPSQAGWIDPETPENARTTTPLVVVPAKPPKEKKTRGIRSGGDFAETRAPPRPAMQKPSSV